MGRTGTLNPYAVLEPVFVGGVTVEKATLHNQDDIRRKDLRIGDTVVIQRAGDVIPQVVAPLTDLRTGLEREFHMPDHCPSCGTGVVQAPGEVAVRCPNPDCPARLVEALKHFVSRAAMDIDGVGDRLVEDLFRLGLVRDPADLYRLRSDDLIELRGFKERKAVKVVSSIEASKGRPFDSVLFALGVPMVGDQTAQLLVRHFPSVEALRAASVEELAMVEGVGPIIAESVAAYFADPRSLDLVRRLAEAGVRLEAETQSGETGEASSPLAGKTFVLTGTLPGAHARGGHRTHREGRRTRDRLGEPRDRLRAGGRFPRIQTGQGGEAGHRPARQGATAGRLLGG